MKPTDIARFWKKVDVRPEEECWEWQGCCFNGGHGCVQFEGRLQPAHRVAWTIANGPIPEGMWVLHRCDNRPCVNPAHLWLGTPRDNVQDMCRKGRGRYPRGERHWRQKHPEWVAHGGAHPRASLTDEQAAEIRRRYVPHQVRMIDLAKEFGTTLATVGRIIRGETYRNVPVLEYDRTQTHCKRGHERTPENVSTEGGCKQCQAENVRRWRSENRERFNDNAREYQRRKKGE